MIPGAAVLPGALPQEDRLLCCGDHQDLKIIKYFRPEAFYRHLKAHKFVQQGCFFFTLFSCNFILLVFYAYVGIHQVKILVFDNCKGIQCLKADTWINPFIRVLKIIPFQSEQNGGRADLVVWSCKMQPFLKWHSEMTSRLRTCRNSTHSKNLGWVVTVIVQI